jgi:hypothetical protein
METSVCGEVSNHQLNTVEMKYPGTAKNKSHCKLWQNVGRICYNSVFGCFIRIWLLTVGLTVF